MMRISHSIDYTSTNAPDPSKLRSEACEGMETKLQYSVAFDLLAANRRKFGECTYNCASIMSKKGIEDNRWTLQLRESMDRTIDRREAEIIRRTMLLHENIFKHQVKELHRLYTTQRKIMEELRAESRIPTSQQQDQAHEAGPSIAPPDDRFMEACGLDLTLNIGFGGHSTNSATNKNKSIYYAESVNDDNNNDKKSRADQDHQRATSSGGSNSATVDQHKQKRSHWLSQDKEQAIQLAIVRAYKAIQHEYLISNSFRISVMFASTRREPRQAAVTI
ncbi:hypothetical protein AKJ16_DCAP00845 [Drosera capensis]